MYTKRNFEKEIQKYSYNWKTGGQFAISQHKIFKMMTYLVVGICLFLLIIVIYISAKPISGIEARRI